MPEVKVYDDLTRQPDRVFLSFGNYEFEILIPPIIQGPEGAQSTATLLREQLAAEKTHHYLVVGPNACCGCNEDTFVGLYTDKAKAEEAATGHRASFGNEERLYPEYRTKIIDLEP